MEQQTEQLSFDFFKVQPEIVAGDGAVRVEGGPGVAVCVGWSPSDRSLICPS